MIKKVIYSYYFIKLSGMVKKSTNVQEPILRRITNHLKNEHNLHALSGEVIPTKRTLPNSKEIVHFIPSLYIPEKKIPIEITADKERDDDYMKIGMLPMVVIESRLRFDSVEEYVNSFLDFHSKWKGKRI